MQIRALTLALLALSVAAVPPTAKPYLPPARRVRHLGHRPRSVLIVRGGPVAAIDAKLRQLHMPPVRGAGASLARVPVAFMWVPQVAGAPDTAANAPSAYWPGEEYVDWVGTDFYSKFPNWAG